jgi:hypothetical protein
MKGVRDGVIVYELKVAAFELRVEVEVLCLLD